MSHAEKCPVCNGAGKIGFGTSEEKPCHGCYGNGWVTVPGDDSRTIIYIPRIYPARIDWGNTWHDCITQYESDIRLPNSIKADNKVAQYRSMDGDDERMGQ